MTLVESSEYKFVIPLHFSAFPHRRRIPMFFVLRRTLQSEPEIKRPIETVLRPNRPVLVEAPRRCPDESFQPSISTIRIPKAAPAERKIRRRKTQATLDNRDFKRGFSKFLSLVKTTAQQMKVKYKVSADSSYWRTKEDNKKRVGFYNLDFSKQASENDIKLFLKGLLDKTKQTSEFLKEGLLYFYRVPGKSPLIVPINIIHNQ